MKLTQHACFAILLGAAGCGGQDPSASEGREAPLRDRLAAIAGDLALDSSGEGVAAVQEYLTRYGYFPNAFIAARHSRWTPIVADSPAVRGEFDEQTERAVLALQANLGLEQTGVVDAATRRLLVQTRCGFPDGKMAGDPNDKWALLGSKWNFNPTFQVLNTNDVSLDEARQAATNAFTTWFIQSSLLLFSTVGTPDISITFGNAASQCGDDLAGGCAHAPAEGGDIFLDTSVRWSVAPDTPSNSMDVESMVLHEAGHALGLDHTSNLGQFDPPITSVMWPILNTGSEHRQLSPDDTVAYSVRYDQWKLEPGQAEDIAAAQNGRLWVLGPESAYGGWLVYNQDINGTREFAGAVAVRIATGPNGIPWIVTLDGGIWRHSTAAATSGTWTQVTGCAKDIAIGGNGDVWVLGCPDSQGLLGVYKWNGGSGFTGADGRGVRIAVSSSGRPLVVASNGTVWRRNSADPNVSGWKRLPDVGATPNDNTDIYADASDSVWLIGKDDEGYVLNENTVDFHTPARNQWVKINSGPIHAIAAGPMFGGNLGPFIASRANRKIYRPVR